MDVSSILHGYFNVILCCIGFKHSDWLKNFNPPIRMLKTILV